jgi:hypothetical protein
MAWRSHPSVVQRIDTRVGQQHAVDSQLVAALVAGRVGERMTTARA